MPVPPVGNGNTGDDARSAGNTESENASTPASQRANAARSKLGSGPKMGEKGEYKPARYKLNTGRTRKDGKPVKPLTREDF